jgi:hypothetical protein
MMASGRRQNKAAREGLLAISNSAFPAERLRLKLWLPISVAGSDKPFVRDDTRVGLRELCSIKDIEGDALVAGPLMSARSTNRKGRSEVKIPVGT